MRFKKLLVGIAAAAVLATGCYREEIAILHNQIDDFTEVHVTPLQEQIDEISSAIEILGISYSSLQTDIQGLQAMKAELEGKISGIDSELEELMGQVGSDKKELIERLEALREDAGNRLAIVEAAISDLQTRIGSLESQIGQLEELRSKLATEINNTRDWVDTTFVSLEEYRKTVDITGSLSEDINDIWNALKDFGGSVSGDLSDLEIKIRNEYRNAMEDAYNSVLGIISKDIDTLHNWVFTAIDGALDDYYTIAQTDQLLDNLKASIESNYKSSDSLILVRIEELDSAQVRAERSLTESYRKAIEDAVTGLETKLGAVGKQIDTVKGRLDGIDSQIASIGIEISDLGDIRAKLSRTDSLANATASALTDLTGRVKTLEEQAQAIMVDISRLESADSVVLAKIDSLAGNDNGLADLIDALEKVDTRVLYVLDSLAGNDTGLKGLIDALTGRVGTLEGDDARIFRTIDSLARNDNGLKELIDALGNADNGLRNRIDSLAGNDNTIKGLIETLQNNTADSLAKLRNADAILNNAITSLRTYVDGELKSGITSDLQSWVSGSYATLARQNALADSLATVYTVLGNLPTEVGGWISSALNDYFTAAQVQAKVDSIGRIVSGIDSKYSNGLDTLGQHLRTEMAAVKTAITSGYESYVATAIAQGGIINGVIHDSIASLRTYVNSELSTINGKITAIETRLTALENVVQSVVFVPEYDDGKIFVPSEYEDGVYVNTKVDIKLRYKINTLNSSFDPSKYTITGDLIETLAATKSSYVGTRIDFKSIKYDKTKSVLECTFNTEKIPASFYDESKSAALSLCIADDKTDISSSYVGLRLQKTTGGGGGGGEDPVGSFRVDPAAISVSNQGGIFTAMVLAQSDYTWIIENTPDWIDIQVIGGIIISLDTYSGTQFISVAISKNTNNEVREGTVVFRRRNSSETATLKIHQEKREIQTIEISPSLPSDLNFDWDGKTSEGGREYKFTVTPNDQIGDWTCTPSGSASWLNVSLGESQGAGVREVTITANRRTKSVRGYYTDVHEADVVFSSVNGERKTVHVTQNFRPDGELIFTPSERSAEFEWNVYGESNAYRYKVQPTDSLTAWTFSEDRNNKDYFNGTGYGESYHDRTTGESNLTVYPVSRNTSFESRVGHTTFTTADGKTSYIFTSTQKARPAQTVEFNPSTNLVEFDWQGKIKGNSSYEVEVIASDDLTDWDYSKDVDWFSVRTRNEKASLQVYSVSSFEKSENPEDRYREGHVTVYPAGPNDEYKETNKIVLTVKQEKRPEQTLDLGIAEGTALEFRWDAKNPMVEPKTVQTYEISVTTSDGLDDWTYYLPGNKTKDDYFTVTKNGEGRVVVSVNGNNNKSDFAPSSTLTIESATGVKYEYPVSQNTRPEQTLTFTPGSGSSFNFGWKGDSDTLTVTSSDNLDDWTVTKDPSNASWVILNKGENKDGVAELVIKVGKTSSERACTLKVTNANGTQTGEFYVIQEARPDQTFNPSPASGTQFDFYKNGKLKENGESSVTVNLNPNDTEYDYSVVKSSNWCTVEDPKDGTLTFSVSNLGNNASRSCTVTITSATPNAQKVTYTINQQKTYIESTIPAEKTEISSGKEYSYTISAYGEGYRIYYSTDVDSGDVDVSGIGRSNSATDISSDVSVKITATKNRNNRLAGSVVFHIIDSDGNEVDNMTVSYSYDTSGYMMNIKYHYYVQAQQ